MRSERPFETTNAVDQHYFVYFNPNKDLFVGDFIELELPSLFSINQENLQDGEKIFELYNEEQEALSKVSKLVFPEDFAAEDGMEVNETLR